MSTRTTTTVADKQDSFDIYQHHDGYHDGPYGLVRHLALARRLAWDLPRFEAADFCSSGDRGAQRSRRLDLPDAGRRRTL